MKNIAYKVINNDPHYPNGFVKDSFETDEDNVNGYIVCSKEDFTIIMLNNVKLLQNYDPSKIINPVKNAAELPNSLPVTPSNKSSDAELFQQFLDWKASQGK